MTTSQVAFSESTWERAREILARYPEGRERSALLPLLHLVQSEEGYVSPAGVAFCAEVLGINKAQVGAVATFYTMYKRRPTGDYLVSVCTNTMCNVLGGQEVYDTLVEHLGVGHDETTVDGAITLEHAECLAACDYGPVMTVNYDFYDGVNPGSAVEVVDRLRAGERPAPTRGARLCTLKEMSLQLAGYSDPREGAIADGPAGAPTLRGVRLAEEYGVAVAGFDPESPIPRKNGDAGPKSAPAKAASAVKAAPAKAASAVKTAAGKVKEAVAHHGTTPQPGEKSVAEAPGADVDANAGDNKDPEVRAAETRSPDGHTPKPDAPGGHEPAQRSTAPGTSDSEPAAEAGVASNPPARDGSPSGDVPQAQERNLKAASSDGEQTP